MTSYSNPFGELPTNLPQPRSLPMPQVGQNARPQTQMPMPSEAPNAPKPMEIQTNELQSILSGLGGLMKQSREDEEKKKAASTAQAIADQLRALKEQRGPMNSDGDAQNSYRAKATMDGAPADMEDYMARNAKFESGANSDAVNPGSGATGLFQFLPSTWNWIAKEAPDLGLTSEGMKDRGQQMKAMHYYTDKSVKTLEPILGRKPTGGELYLLHLLGHSGGPAVLSDLDAPITKTISEGAYKGNPFLRQYTTGRDLIAGLNHQFGG